MERLNKILAHAGIGSRRYCDELIRAGRVKLDGAIVTDLGIKVDPDQQKIAVDDHPVKSERLVYWLVHKPPGYVCTNRDPAGRPLVIDLLPHVAQRVYTVGRLDEGSEGLILLTNDGDLAHALMHPRYGVDKTYQVLVAGKPSKDDLQRLLDGVWLSDGKARAQAVRRMKPQGDSTWLRITLAEGKNREIRRMLAKFSHKVMRLKRVAIGPILLDRLPKGKARKLSLAEIKSLQQLVARSEKKLEASRKKARGEPANPASLEDTLPVESASRTPVPAPPKRTRNTRSLLAPVPGKHSSIPRPRKPARPR